MSGPFFSVVMPVYNQEEYVSQAIQSVLDQTIESWELLIVDNHSTDGTVDLIKTYKDPRIKLSFIDNHGVIAKSRNQAIRHSSGEYIAFLDSDDAWRPSKLEEVLHILNYKSGLIYHWVNLISDNGSNIGKTKSRRIVQPMFEDLLIHGNPIVNSSVVVSRKSLLEIGLLSESKELIGVEDYNSWLKLALIGMNFILIPKTLGDYRLHSESISSRFEPAEIPVRAFSELEAHIGNILMAKIQSKFWEIEGKARIRRGHFQSAANAFAISANNCDSRKKTKFQIYSMTARFFSTFLSTITKR